MLSHFFFSFLFFPCVAVMVVSSVFTAQPRCCGGQLQPIPASAHMDCSVDKKKNTNKYKKLKIKTTLMDKSHSDKSLCSRSSSPSCPSFFFFLATSGTVVLDALRRIRLNFLYTDKDIFAKTSRKKITCVYLNSGR